MIFVLSIYTLQLLRAAEKKGKKKRRWKSFHKELIFIWLSSHFPFFSSRTNFRYITCLGRTWDRLTRKRKYNAIREENGKFFSHSLSLSLIDDISTFHLLSCCSVYSLHSIIVLVANIKKLISQHVFKAFWFRCCSFPLAISSPPPHVFFPPYIVEAINNLSWNILSASERKRGKTLDT